MVASMVSNIWSSIQAPKINPYSGVAPEQGISSSDSRHTKRVSFLATPFKSADNGVGSMVGNRSMVPACR